VAEITGLLNRRTVLSRTGGSNPPLTAKKVENPLSNERGFCFQINAEIADQGSSGKVGGRR
jgi:hypothetical protein